MGKKEKWYSTFTECHEGNVLVFKVGHLEVYGGGTSRGYNPYSVDLLVNLTGYTKTTSCVKMNEEAKEKLGVDLTLHIPEITIDWPDMSVPPLGRVFWEQLALVLLKASKNDPLKVLFFCVGGHGRTGTALAILAGLLGVTEADPVKYVRDAYCKKAVEAQSQIDYIQEITGLVVKEKPSKGTVIYGGGYKYGYDF